MDIVKKQEKITPLITFIMIIFIVSSILNVRMTVVKAEETGSGYSVQEIVDNSVFVTFRKGENTERGKYMVACYFVPKEYYNPSYNYGVIIFPKEYGIYHKITGDYIKNAAEKGVAIINSRMPSPVEGENGYGVNCGVNNMHQQNLSLLYSFIFYVQDEIGNVAYMQANFASYNTLAAGEMSIEEVFEKAELVSETYSSFRGIVLKIQELVETVWGYVLIAFSSTVLVWGVHIGVRVSIAKKNEEKINARAMVKRLVIGVLVMFLIAVSVPALINGLSYWVTW